MKTLRNIVLSLAFVALCSSVFAEEVQAPVAVTSTETQTVVGQPAKADTTTKSTKTAKSVKHSRKAAEKNETSSAN